MTPQIFRQLRLALCLPKNRFGDCLRPPVSSEIIEQWESGTQSIPRSVLKQLMKIHTLFATEVEAFLSWIKPPQTEASRRFVFYLSGQDFFTQEPTMYRRFQGNPYLYHSFLLYLNHQLDIRYGGFIEMEAYYPTVADKEYYHQHLVTQCVQVQGELSLEWQEELAHRKATGQGYHQVNTGKEMKAILETLQEETYFSSMTSNGGEGNPFDENLQDTLQSMLTFYQTTPSEGIEAWVDQNSTNSKIRSLSSEEQEKQSQEMTLALDLQRLKKRLRELRQPCPVT